MKKMVGICLLIILMLLFGCNYNTTNSSTTDSMSVSEENIVNNKEMTLSLSFGERTGIYEGELQNGIPHGNGSFHSQNLEGNKWIYEGKWVNGHYNGWGKTTWESGIFEAGYYKDDEIIVPPKDNPNAEYITDNDIDRMYSNPINYAGKYVELQGQIFTDIERQQDFIFFQIFADPQNGEKNTAIYIFEPDLKINQDDYISINGFVSGINSFENAYGGKLSIPEITVISYEIITAKDVLYPTIKEYEINQSVEQFGYKISIDKIEFAELETRIFITINNDGKSKFRASQYECKLIQESTQYEQKSNYDVDYPEIHYEILNGVQSKGVITFPPLDFSDFQIIWECRSDDYNEKLEPYKFEIII